MTELEAIASRLTGPPWSERRHKAEFVVGDAMQVKGKKLSQGVLMKSLKGAHFKVKLYEKLQQV